MLKVFTRKVAAIKPLVDDGYYDDALDEPEVLDVAANGLLPFVGLTERGPLPFVPGRVERITCAAEAADADEHAAGIVTHEPDTHSPPAIVRPRRDDEEAAWDERNCGERWE